MPRCRESSGVLFNHPCDEEASDRCGQCSKPICARHQRKLNEQPICIGCAREHVKHRPVRDASISGFGNDPYFFFYYDGFGFNDDPYDEADYALFEAGAADPLNEDHEEAGWEGS